MRALGMASFSTIASSPELTRQARKYYVAAIGQTHVALASASDAPRDSTLLAVVILAHFEAITGEDQRSIKAWSEHIRGTAALIQLRGPDQMRTPAGKLLFMQASTNLITDCVRNALPMPKCVHDLMQGTYDSQDPLWLNHTALLKLTDFYSDVACGRMTNPAAIITQALQHDLDLQKIFSDAPSLWSYDILSVAQTGTEPPFPDNVHSYKSSLSAQVWNSMRCGRILVHSIIAGILRQVIQAGFSSPDSVARLQASVDILNQLKMDILSSVQQHLNCATSGKGSRATTSSMGLEKISSGCAALTLASMKNFSRFMDIECGQLPVLRTSRCYSLLHSLHLVGRVSDAGTQMRQSASNILYVVRKSLGIQQAFILAEELNVETA